MAKPLTIYLHFPCFDGVISAVLAGEYSRQKLGWDAGELVPVDYDAKDTWIKRRLAKPAAVVDFLYHPDATLWADHHQTSFLSESLRDDYRKKASELLIYDAQSKSCSSLLWRKFGRVLREERLREMVQWADRIDGAKYNSVKEAVLGSTPALRISFSLMSDSSAEYCRFLVHSLSKGSLWDVSHTKRVSENYKSVRDGIRKGLGVFKKASHLQKNGIVVYDVESAGNAMVSRYAPYYFFPQARYSIGVTRTADQAKITAMRNPWRRFKSQPLGQIFEKYGGGGHQRVASVVVERSRDAELPVLIDAILRDIQDNSARKTRDREVIAGD